MAEDDLDEPNSGQRREYERQQIISRAVEAADRIIMDGSGGSVEETDYLTGEVTGQFLAKVQHSLRFRLLKLDIENGRGFR